MPGIADRPAIDFESLYGVLVRLSQLVIDIREVQELDVNPLLADGKGVVALDARIKVAPVGSDLKGKGIGAAKDRHQQAQQAEPGGAKVPAR